MKINIPIALGASAISAVVLISATTGILPVRMLLLALVTLPTALAGFAYNVPTATLAAGLATLWICAISPTLGIMFGLASVLPSVGLQYLTGLHRETTPTTTEWYPIGRVVIAAALMAGCIVGALLTLAAGDLANLDKLRAVVSDAVRQTAKAGFPGLPAGGNLSDADVNSLADIMINLMPGLSASLWMASILFCLWLAAHVALAGGHLTRPWPALAQITYPAGTPLLLALALAGVLMLGGVARLIALGFAGALYFAYVLLGLAIVHERTRSVAWRNPLLTGVYVALVIATSPVSLILALTGLIDSFKPLRRSEPPPSA